MNLTVGLLTLDCETFLPDQLRALSEGLAGVAHRRLVIVDGGSTDRTIDIARTMAADAAIVEMPANPGFAAMANAAAAADPDSDAVLILSRTALLRPGCAARLLGALAEPGVGVTVPRLLDAEGRPRASLRRRPTLARAWGESVLGGRITSRFPALTEVVAAPAGYDENTQFDWATGAVTMFSRQCLTALGGWDESFFLYSEETDFELRAADHGFSVRFVPAALATHLGGESRVRPELFSHLCANRVRLYSRRHGRPAADAFWAAILFGELLRLPVRRSVAPAAIGKLLRERRTLVHGGAATHPFARELPWRAPSGSRSVLPGQSARGG